MQGKMWAMKYFEMSTYKRALVNKDAFPKTLCFLQSKMGLTKDFEAG